MSRFDDPARLGTVLTVWAHPDDETYLAGGLLAAVRDAGLRAVCVTATRGEAADPHATEAERAALARERTEELEAALDILGVTEHHWLDLPDGGCAQVDAEAPVARLAQLVDDVQPSTMVTFGPDGFTGHEDHRTVSRWTDLVLRRTATRPLLLHAVASESPVDAALDEELGVFELGRPRVCRDDELTLLLALDGAALDRKVAALLRQRSQTGALVEAVGVERFRRWVATERFATPVAEAVTQRAG